VIVEGTRSPSAPNLRDGPSIHFPNPKVARSLKRLAVEEKYLLPAGYKFVILNTNATVNKPPPDCIGMYRAALIYDLRFPLHEVNFGNP